MNVINTLLPLIALVALGTALRRVNFADDGFFRKCNALVFWVALPCLLLDKTAGGARQLGDAMRIFQVLLFATVACIVAAYLLGWALRTPRRSLGAFVQGAFRGNLAFVGLAVIVFSFEAAASGDAERSATLAALAMAPLIPLYNLVSVVVLLGGHGRRGRSTAALLGEMLVKIVTNPLLIACVAGILMSMADIAMPGVVHRILATVGSISLPLALIGIGASLTLKALRGDVLRSMSASVIKLLISPLLGVLIGRAMGLASDELRIAAILLGCPTAVASFVMADQLDGDAPLAGSIVLTSTVLSAITLAVILSYPL